METAVISSGGQLEIPPFLHPGYYCAGRSVKILRAVVRLGKDDAGQQESNGYTVTTPQNPSSRNPAIGSIDFGGLLAPGVFWGEVGAKHLPRCLIYVVATGIWYVVMKLVPSTLGFIQKWVSHGPWYDMDDMVCLKVAIWIRKVINQLLDLRHLSAGPWVLALRRAQKDPWCSWRSRSPCAYGVGNEMQGCMHTFVCRTTPSCILVGLANFGWQTSKNRS